MSSTVTAIFPVLPVWFPGAHRPRGDRVAVGLVVDQDCAERVADVWIEGREAGSERIRSHRRTTASARPAAGSLLAVMDRRFTDRRRRSMSLPGCSVLVKGAEFPTFFHDERFGGCLLQPCSQGGAEKSRHRFVLGHYASSAQRSSVCPWNDRAITLLVVVSSVSVKWPQMGMIPGTPNCA
jgi:hypothetical protein